MNSLEAVTSENFDSVAYLLANPDLQRSGITTGEELARHFEEYGSSENRFQIRRELLDNSTYRQEKFKTFSDVLKDSPSDAAKFPIFFSKQHYSQDEYQAESANADCGDFLAEAIAHPQNRYLDLGCGFRRTVLPNVLYLEVYPSVTADVIVSPDEPYPIESNVFDGIVCADVLEHVAKPWEVIGEIHRMLKPGGKIFIDWPFLQPVHGFPSHYFNATRQGLVNIFETSGFEVTDISTRDHQAPDHTFKWFLTSLMSSLSGDLKETVRSTTIADLMNCDAGTGIWREVLQAIPDATRSELACGNLLIGKKPD